MPDFSAVPADRLGLCVYETTTKGTPMTPVFVDAPEVGSRATLNLTTGRLEFRLDEELHAA